ncbi:MAG: hypothetical protein ACJ0IZ_00540 [Verrucomicrobiales bacterium]
MSDNSREKRNKSGRILFEKLEINKATIKSLKGSKRYKIADPERKNRKRLYYGLIIFSVIGPIVMLFLIVWAGNK